MTYRVTAISGHGLHENVKIRNVRMAPKREAQADSLGDVKAVGMSKRRLLN